MNVQLLHEASEIRLKSAWLLYGDPNGISYISKHSIELDKNGSPIIQPGENLDIEAIESIIESLYGEEKLEIISDKVIAKNKTKLVFWSPSKKRATWMDCDEPFGKRKGVVWHPDCVFAIDDNELRVFCVPPGRPDAETQLLQSPYLNVYKDGGVCMGSRALPKPHIGNIQEIEAAFFTSEFTHTNRNHLVRYEGGSYGLWGDLMDGKFSDGFPLETLIPVTRGNGEPFTLADFVASI